MLIEQGVKLKVDGLLGKIVHTNGGIMTFSTPHGTQITAGFVWMARRGSALTEEEHAELREYEQDAFLKYQKVYEKRN